MVTLESSKLLSHLSAEDMNALKAHTRLLRFAAGQEIFKKGEPGDGLYVVREGFVNISDELEGGGRLILSRVSPGDVFGEMTLIERHPRSAWAEAGEDCELYFVPRDPMVAVLRKSSDLALTLVQEISERLRDFNRVYLEKVLQAERLALVGRFASSIIHDLKNPLTIIGIAAMTAGRKDATAEARQLSQDRITKQVDRITSLVNDILEFTRGSQRAPSLYLADYVELIMPLLQEFTAELNHRRIELVRPQALPSVMILMNPRRLSRVFHNLIDNAVDALPNGGKIEIRIQVQDGNVVTEVEDSGSGIPEQHLSKIFDAFATFGKVRGTGLGLSIVQQIIEEHQGRITVRNREGGGAIFAFTLPLPS